MSYFYVDLGNIPNCSSSINLLAIVAIFGLNNGSEGNHCNPNAGPVGFPSRAPITRSVSPESPAVEPWPETQPNPHASSGTHPPVGFRSKVTTPAASEASKSRRKSPPKYFCKHCRQGFTRKSNLDQHYQSHLGVPNKSCPFCKQMFMSSISRHKKSCKQNPNRHGSHPPHLEPEAPKAE